MQGNLQRRKMFCMYHFLDIEVLKTKFFHFYIRNVCVICVGELFQELVRILNSSTFSLAWHIFHLQWNLTTVTWDLEGMVILTSDNVASSFRLAGWKIVCNLPVRHFLFSLLGLLKLSASAQLINDTAPHIKNVTVISLLTRNE